jgi:hypothetical protein
LKRGDMVRVYPHENVRRVHARDVGRTAGRLSRSDAQSNWKDAMSTEEILKLMDETHAREQKLLKEIENIARHAIPVLKDHGLGNLASEVDRVVFQLDAIRQDMLQALHTCTAPDVIALLKKVTGLP